MNALIIISISILVILVGAVAVSWVISYYMNNHFSKYISQNQNTIRSFVIDMTNKSFKYFDKNNIRNIRTAPLEKFTVPFSSNQIDKINEWLNELTKKTSKVNDYLECEVYVEKKKKYTSILKCNHVDYEKKIIHLDSYLFLHLNTRNKSGRKANDVTLEEALRRMRIHPSIKGFTYNFKFACFDGPTRKEMDRLLFVELKEIAIRRAYPPKKYLLEVSDSEFSIVDASGTDHNHAMDFVHDEVNAIRRFLEINGLTNKVTIAVGIVSNSYFPGNIKRLVIKAQEMSNIAFEKNVLIITYSRGMLNNQEDKFDTEIEHVIKEKRTTHSFTPIYDLNHDKIMGYINKVMPFNTSAKTINELYLRAVKTDETKKLLQALVKDAFDIFNSQNTDPDAMLFIHLKFADALSFSTYVKFLSTKETPIVAIFNEYDVQHYKNNNKDFTDIIAKLKAKNILPCLELSDKNLILDSSIYASFSYFIVSLNLNNERLHSRISGTNIDYRVIVEKLLKYNRPIIVADVNGWTSIEFVVRSGISYISSPTLVGTEKRISTISSKNIAKIKRMMN